MKNTTIDIGYGDVKPISIGLGLPLVFIGGPCAIENRDHAFFMCEKILKICSNLIISYLPAFI